MNYYIDLFSPETAKAFEKSDRNISGFRISRKTYVLNQKIGPGDRFICYCTKVQRLIGVLEVLSDPFEDNSAIFSENDPFTLRFNVKVLVWLPLNKAIPIHDPGIWKNLSFTKDLPLNSQKWTYMVFSRPRLWPKEDSKFLEAKLMKQAKVLVDYTLIEADEKKLKPTKIRLSN